MWNDSDPTTCAPIGCPLGLNGGQSATGGSPSSFFTTPPYQRGATGFTTRSTSDVSWNAGSYTRVFGVITTPGYAPGFYIFAGASEGAPAWAGVVALVNQAVGHPVGQFQPWLYAHVTYTGANPLFHDITIGSNGEFIAGSNSILGPGYSAVPGWDPPTGIGTPDVRNLVNAVAGTPY